MTTENDVYPEPYNPYEGGGAAWVAVSALLTMIICGGCGMCWFVWLMTR